MRETWTAMERHLGPLALLVALAGCAQFPPATGDGDADTDTDADADVPPIDCGPGLEAVDLNRAGSAIPGGFTYTGTLSAGQGVTGGSCATYNGNEAVFAFTPTQSGDLMVDTFGTSPDLDTVLHVRTQCEAAGTEIGCNDDWVLNYSCYLSALEVIEAAVEGVPVYIFVDGWDGEEAGEYTVTAIARQVQALDTPCDPSGVLNRCVRGAVCRDGTCQPGHRPTLTGLTALTDSTWMRLVAEGTDEDQDVTAIDITLTLVSGGDPWSWPAPLNQVEWAGTSFFAYVDLDLSGIAAVATAEAAVIDASQISSDTRQAVPQPMPVRAEGESCDPDWLTSWCDVGLWCDEATTLCVASAPPAITSMTVRYLSDGYRVQIEGTDAEGDVSSVQYTFVNTAGVDVPLTTSTPQIDIPGNLAWPVSGETSFTLGFQAFGSAVGATGLRVELVDVAGNESASRVAQGTPIDQLAGGEVCDPVAWQEICPETCLSGQCADAATCRQQRCAGALPSLAPGTPTLVQLRTLDAGCFMASCNAWTGPEAIYTLEVPSRSRLVLAAQHATGYYIPNLFLEVRTSCENENTWLGCADSYAFVPSCTWDFTPSTVFDQLVVDDLAAGTYYVLADTWGPAGDFELLAELTPL